MEMVKTQTNLKTRIVWVDYLRAIGLILVILPHVFGINSNVAEMIFACNVPIMVFLSGFVSYKSFEGSVFSYYVKRFKSIVLPAWIFFVLYFGIVALVSIFSTFPYTWKDIVKTFLFMDGIGYTWVITVFIMNCIFTPIISWIIHRMPTCAFIIPILYALIGLSIAFLKSEHFLSKVFLYCAGYVLIGFVGYTIHHNKKYTKLHLAIMVVTYLIAIIFSFKNGFIPWQMSKFKYPPTVLYVSYGTTVAILLMVCLKAVDKFLLNSPVTKGVTYISRNSFQLYLWHIMGLFLATSVNNKFVKFIIVLFVTLLGTEIYKLVQKNLIRLFRKKQKT